MADRPTLFPSLLPDDEETYTSEELSEWDWLEELRPIAAELETSDIGGQSTKIEVVDFLAGRFTQSELNQMRDEINTDNPDFSQITKTVTTIQTDNGSD